MPMLEILQYAVGFGVLILFTVSGILILRKFSRGSLKDPGADSASRALEEVHARLGELDSMNQRIGELEERLDFAERLLATRHEEQRLGPAQE
jgi:hypothetical protein